MRDSTLSESLWFGPGRSHARSGPFHVVTWFPSSPVALRGTGIATLASREHARALSYGKMEIGPPRSGIAYKREHGHDGEAWGRPYG